MPQGGAKLGGAKGGQKKGYAAAKRAKLMKKGVRMASFRFVLLRCRPPTLYAALTRNRLSTALTFTAVGDQAKKEATRTGCTDPIQAYKGRSSASLAHRVVYLSDGYSLISRTLSPRKIRLQRGISNRLWRRRRWTDPSSKLFAELMTPIEVKLHRKVLHGSQRRSEQSKSKRQQSRRRRSEVHIVSE